MTAAIGQPFFFSSFPLEGTDRTFLADFCGKQRNIPGRGTHFLQAEACNSICPAVYCDMERMSFSTTKKRKGRS
ncbi:MAG: hypothetical protein J6A21_08880 [Lentisphaeria bacterium]|nr:hypothetical protein [Lentisphaeria bacterium]